MSEIDLQPFCSTEAGRAYLTKPWTRDGFTWATNGHILVRIPARRGIKKNPMAPDAKRALECHREAEFAALPSVRWPDESPRRKCEICGGNGKDPEFETEPCFDCEGDGLAHGPLTSVLIRGVHFQVKYVRLIQSLPRAEFASAPNQALANFRDTQPSPFRFDGGVGALMPMSRSSLDNCLGDIEGLERAL
jgi:hypothetical protein